MTQRRATMFAWVQGRLGRRMALVVSSRSDDVPEGLRAFVCFWAERPRITGTDLDRCLTARQLKDAVLAVQLPADAEYRYQLHMGGYWRQSLDDKAWQEAVRQATSQGKPLAVYAQNRRGEAVLYTAEEVRPSIMLQHFKDAIGG